MNINHKILGSITDIDTKIKKLKDIRSRLNIIKYHNKRKVLKLKGSTIPHAGYEYCGLLSLFIIFKILEYNNKEITILWFQHNKNSKQEHFRKVENS